MSAVAVPVTEPVPLSQTQRRPPLLSFRIRPSPEHGNARSALESSPVARWAPPAKDSVRPRPSVIRPVLLNTSSRSQQPERDADNDVNAEARGVKYHKHHKHYDKEEPQRKTSQNTKPQATVISDSDDDSNDDDDDEMHGDGDDNAKDSESKSMDSGATTKQTGLCAYLILMNRVAPSS